MKKIDLGLIELDIHDCPIGVSLSGGADSSILLYLLMKHTTAPIHVISCSNQAKRNLNPRHAFNVIEKCIQLTGNNNIKHHTYFVEVKNRATYLAGLTEFIDNKTVEMMYTGFTANPPLEVTDKFLLPLPTETGPRRDPIKTRSPYPDPGWYTPFTNLDKKDIFELYKREDVLGSLYPVTYSCENPSMNPHHCGECWWCEERKWGFGYL
jgi:7-cyano-7-deazaguanine synthase in queuosine biosynthesis